MAIHQTRYERPLFAFLTLLVTIAQAQLHLSNPSNPLPFSPECNRALTAAVNCTTLESATSAQKPTALSDLTAEFLDQLCTDECKASVKGYQEAVKTTCANEDLNAASNASVIVQGASGVYTPKNLPDHYVRNYNEHCLQDSKGDYCILKLRNSESLGRCDECTLLMFREKIESGVVHDDGLMEQYSSMSATCERSKARTSYPTTAVTFNYAQMKSYVNGLPKTTTTATAAASIPTLLAPGVNTNCGKYYQRGGHVHCQTIAKWNQIKLDDFLFLNPGVKSDCSNLYTGYNYCVQPVGSIETYPGYGSTSTTAPTNTPVASTATPTLSDSQHISTDAEDTTPTPVSNGQPPKPCAQYRQIDDPNFCEYIASKSNILLYQFHFLNPQLNEGCSNLQVGQSYCVKPVGAIEAYPGYKEPRWTPKLPTGPYAPTPINLLSRPPSTLTPWTSIPKPSTAPLAPGTRKDCKTYRDNTFGEVPCHWIATQVSISHFADWNPSLVWWDCRLANNTRYCTLLGDDFWISDDEYDEENGEYDDVPENAAEGSKEECYEWYEVEEGDTCDDIFESFQLEMEEFFEWNPSVKEDCSKLLPETSYCIYAADVDDI